MRNKKHEIQWCEDHFKPVMSWQIKAYWFGLIPNEGHIAVKIVSLPFCDRAPDEGQWLDIEGHRSFETESEANYWILRWCEQYL